MSKDTDADVEDFADEMERLREAHMESIRGVAAGAAGAGAAEGRARGRELGRGARELVGG